MKTSTSLLFFWLFILSFGKVSSQNLYETYQNIIASTDPRNDLRVDSLLNSKSLEKNYKTKIKIIHDYFLYNHNNKKDYVKALKYSMLEVKVFEDNNLYDTWYINALYNTGRLYYRNAEYKKSISFFQKVIEKDTFNNQVGQAYAEIGRAYGAIGNYTKSVAFFEKGIDLLTKQENHQSLFAHYTNLATVYYNIGTKESIIKRLEVLKKAESLTDKIKVSLGSKLNLYTRFANQYGHEYSYDFKKSKDYFQKALSIGLKYNDSLLMSSVYNNIADLYNTEKNDSARYYIKKGLETSINKTAKARLYSQYANYYLRKGQLDLALESIQNALNNNLNIQKNTDYIPNTHDLNTSSSHRYALSFQDEKIEILIKIYHERFNRHHLELAISNVEVVDELANLIQSNTLEQSTKLIWRRYVSRAYLKGIYAAHLLGDNNAAFSFMEKNKALLLSESIVKNTAFSTLPKNVSNIESAYNKTIYTLERTLAKNNNRQLKDSLFTVKLAYEKYIDSIQVLYPAYFNRTIDLVQTSLPNLKSTLKENQAVISYSWNQFDDANEKLLGLISVRDTTFTFEVQQVDSLKSIIRNYRKLISKPFDTKEEQIWFQKIAFDLYQRVFPTVEVRNLIEDKDLIILTDGDLQNIPFEALITKEKSFHYLLQSSKISYAYTMSFSIYNSALERNTQSNFIGYSPVLFEETTLPKLENTAKEITEIENIIEGSVLLNEAASKEHFLTNSRDSKIIHLATHADASNNPWIAFSDGKLELHELYTYKNNADLVVLSACSTTLGEVAQGEGVLSLARGFFYSGANSVISSLWNVNDASTLTIMTNFYKNINEGQSKSEALTNAKRNYLTTHSLSEQSPYYWSSFVLIGDTAAIDLSNNVAIYILTFSVFLGLVILIVKKKKN